MNAKEAVNLAKNYIQDMFADENMTDLGLEEVEFSSEAKCWRITVGFARPWEKNAVRSGGVFGTPTIPRSYKTVTVKDETGEVDSVKNRQL